MVKIEKRILIKAPMRTIFSFVDDPFKLAQSASGMMELSDVIHLKNGGRSFHCVVKMVGSQIQCVVECTERIANRSLAYKISGGIRGSIRWFFQLQNDETEVTLSIEYNVPHPLLKRNTESAIIRRNEHGIQLLLCNLKSEIEREMQLRDGVKSWYTMY